MILRLRVLTLLFDFLLLIAAYSVAYFFRVGFIFSSDLPFQPYLLTGVLSALVWVGTNLIFAGYQVGSAPSSRRQIITIALSGIAGISAFGLIFYFTQKAVFSRLLLLEMFLLGTFVMLLCHLFFHSLEKHFIKKGLGITRLLIIGSHRGVKKFIQGLRKATSSTVPCVILDGYGTSQKDILGVPIMGKLNILEDMIDRFHIDAILQADHIEQVITIVQFCKMRGLEYYLLPYVLGVYQDELRIHHLEYPVLATSSVKRHSWLSRLLG